MHTIMSYGVNKIGNFNIFESFEVIILYLHHYFLLKTKLHIKYSHFLLLQKSSHLKHQFCRHPISHTYEYVICI